MNTIVNTAIPAAKTGQTGNASETQENKSDEPVESQDAEELKIDEGDDVGGEVPLTGLKSELKDIYY